MSRPGQPISKQRSAWIDIALPDPVKALAISGRACERRVHDGVLLAFATKEPDIGWHLSISFRNHRGEFSRYPSWDEIAHARYELLPHELDFVMHLPPPEQFVALHDTTFHLHQHPEPGQ